MATGRILVTPELLRHWLHLPDNSRIVNAALDSTNGGIYIAFDVDHPDIRQHVRTESSKLPVLRPRFKSDPDHPIPDTVFVDWGQT